MRNARWTLAASLIGGLAWSAVSSSIANADGATSLMSGVPSVAALVEALTPAAPTRTRGIRPSNRAGNEASRPAVDLAVNFDFDSSDLTPMAQSILDNLATALNTDLASYRFTIEGHTDAVGSERYNQGLSERRARAVHRYLVELYRVDPDRLAPIGKGERELLQPDQPTAPPNRRVRVINRG